MLKEKYYLLQNVLESVTENILRRNLKEKVMELEYEVGWLRNEIHNLHLVLEKKSERYEKLEDYITLKDNVRL